jgi:hypothetical protein
MWWENAQSVIGLIEQAGLKLEECRNFAVSGDKVLIDAAIFRKK